MMLKKSKQIQVLFILEKLPTKDFTQMIKMRKLSLASYDITCFRLIKAGVTLLCKIIASVGKRTLVSNLGDFTK